MRKTKCDKYIYAPNTFFYDTFRFVKLYRQSWEKTWIYEQKNVQLLDISDYSRKNHLTN